MTTKGMTVHVQDECLCGQMHEVVYHMKEGGCAVGFEGINLGQTKGTSEVIDPIRKLEFTGSYDKVELSGVEWKQDEGIVCKKCSANLMYGLVADETEIKEQEA